MAGYQYDPVHTRLMVPLYIDCSLHSRVGGFLRISGAEERNRDHHQQIMVVEGELADIHVMAPPELADQTRQELENTPGLLEMAQTHAAIRRDGHPLSITRIAMSAGGAVSHLSPAMAERMNQRRLGRRQTEQ